MLVFNLKGLSSDVLGGPFWFNTINKMRIIMPLGEHCHQLGSVKGVVL
jgi:hypothetical protein